MKNKILVYLGFIFILLYSGCSNKLKENSVPENIKNIEVLVNNCANHDVKSCYKAGEYYLKESKIKKESLRLALIYFDKGCINWETVGFWNKRIVERKDIDSCLKEAKLLKDNKLIYHDQFLTSLKFNNVAKIYYEKGDLNQSKEYYLLSLSYYKDEEVYYKLSQIALIEKEYNLSKKYYMEYVRYKSLVRNRLLKLIKAKLLGKHVLFEYDILLLSNGTVSDVFFSKSSKVDNLNKLIERKIKDKIYYQIPSEYNVDNMTISVKVQY